MTIEEALKAKKEKLPIILIHPLLGEIEYRYIEKIGKLIQNSKSGKVIYRLYLKDKVQGMTVADITHVRRSDDK